MIVAYCRVSSTGQKGDLVNQKAALVFRWFRYAFGYSTYSTTEQFCIATGKPVALWLEDIGSGPGIYERKNFVRLMEMVERGEVSEIVIVFRWFRYAFGYSTYSTTAHKDRLVRFGYEWFNKFTSDHGTTLTVMNAETLSPEEDFDRLNPAEMTKDLLCFDGFDTPSATQPTQQPSIIHCFSSRLYGLRKYKKQITQLAQEKPLDENHSSKKL